MSETKIVDNHDKIQANQTLAKESPLIQAEDSQLDKADEGKIVQEQMIESVQAQAEDSQLSKVALAANSDKEDSLEVAQHVTVNPHIGFIVKCKREDNSKIFINVLYHEIISGMASTQAKPSIGTLSFRFPTLSIHYF